jgi:AcrR family transcriptional regulator
MLNVMAGLRQRKKSETRQRIADAGTLLFLQRGFDNVTVAEVAEAAGVSKMTVFNYFARKEDLYFDRDDEAVELLTAAVTGRADGEGVLPPLRRLLLGLLEQRHPLSGLRDGVNRFWEVVLESPALRAAAWAAVLRLEADLTRILAAATPDPDPDLVAGLVVTAYRTVYLGNARRLLAGERADAIAPDQAALLNRAFTALETAFPTWGATRR